MLVLLTKIKLHDEESSDLVTYETLCTALVLDYMYAMLTIEEQKERKIHLPVDFLFF